MKSVLVTGAASGIGAEFARQLAEQGYRVLAVDRAPSSYADSLMLDLTEADAPQKILSWCESLGLLPDLIINNAGIFDFDTVCDLTPERLSLYLDLHCRAVTQICRAFIPLMIARGSGRILNMSSMSCWMPVPGLAMYAATKAYIRTFSRALSLELHGTGVTLTVACPGGIATDLFGLPQHLKRLALRLHAIQRPDRFVRGALKATFRGRRQYINAPLINRPAIALVGCMPDSLRRQVKPLLLDRIKSHRKS